MESLEDCIRWMYEWQYTNDDHFFIHLIRLFNKADPTNRMRLSEAFPIQAIAYEAWESAPSQEVFFAKHIPGFKERNESK